jgi:hypothetical protein
MVGGISRSQRTLTCITVNKMPPNLHAFASQTDKSWRHQYIHVYESLFEPMRNRTTTVLEIGVLEGGSLVMWRDYFSNAIIYGLDVEDRTNCMAGEDRVKVTIADAYTDETLQAINTKFDVIIDDGPHTLESQLFCAKHYPWLLKSNGILVIEDIPNPEWIPQLADVVPDDFKMYMYAIDRRVAPNRQSVNDELMFVIDLRYVETK